jgi:hypothetical protein
MQGRSTTILLLTLATFLDELLHLASVLSFERSSKPALLHLRYHSSSPQARSPNLRWWPILAAAGSPVTHPESQINLIISREEQYTAERSRNGDAHTTQTRWAIDIMHPNPQLELQRQLELEENESEVRPGSNAPMGWADPRLRGGQMLDVRFCIFHFAHKNIRHRKTCLTHLISCSTYIFRSCTHAHLVRLPRIWRATQRDHLRSLRSLHPHPARAATLRPDVRILDRMSRYPFRNASRRQFRRCSELHSQPTIP